MFFKVYCFLARASHFVGWSRKLKVHRANLRTISSYPVRSSIDTVHNNIFFFGVFLFLFSFVYFPLDKHIYFNEEFFSKTLFACFLDKQLLFPLIKEKIVIVIKFFSFLVPAFFFVFILSG